MPILVRVVHRDNFLSWCLTYVDNLRPRALTVTGVSPSSAASLACQLAAVISTQAK